MQELGLSATANYKAAISDALGASVDAARAYFPVQAAGSGARAQIPSAAERALLARLEVLDSALSEAPRIGAAKEGKESEIVGELRKAALFFTPNAVVGTACGKQEVRKKSVWNGDWMVPELLPAELHPARKRKRTKSTVITASNTDAGAPALRGLANDAATATGDEQEDGDVGAEDGLEMEVEEEDVDELDADYTAGAHFDDDDGYEEVDSGRDEAVI